MKKGFLIFILSFLFIVLLLFFVYSKRVVNIVLTTDANYVNYTMVTIKSIIENKNILSNYNINVLCVDVDDSEIKRIKNLQTLTAHVNPIKQDLSKIDYIKELGLKKQHHVSRADLFKFFLPEIFPNLDKILYLDSDLIILKDLYKLYSTNIEGHPLAAVEKYNIWIPEDKKFYVKDEKPTFNCGVMVLNLKYFRDNDLTEKLVMAKMSEKKHFLMTQQAFNKVIPMDDVVLLSPIYNRNIRWSVMVWNEGLDGEKGIKNFYNSFLNDIKEFDDFENNVVVIHYSGEKKPWFKRFFTKISYVDKWWKYAEMIDKDWNIYNAPFDK